MEGPQTRTRAQHAAAALLLATALAALATCALDPPTAEAALREAAGAGNAGSGGFARLGAFMDKVSTYLIWLAVPAAGLGIVVGGGMLVAGSPRAQRVLALTAVGFAIVVSAKGLVA